MRSMTVLALFAGALLLAAGCRSDAPAGDAEASGFTPLFNGRDLDGLVVVLDSPWTVEDGVLRSEQDPAGRREGESWLLTKRSYRDFVLRLRFRITPGGNSGVFVRVPVGWEQRLADPEGGPVPWDAGYEVNINNDEPNYPTGSIWALAKGPHGLQREGEWNDLEIRVEGNRLWSRVNGTPAIDGFELPPRSAEGSIGFQRHGGAAYRDKVIEIREVLIRGL